MLNLRGVFLAWYTSLVLPLPWQPSSPPSTTVEPSHQLTIPPDFGVVLKPPSCTFKPMDGFIRILCRSATGADVIRCHGSNQFYTYNFIREIEDYEGEVCSEDPVFYQACPGEFRDVVGGSTTKHLPVGPLRFLCGDYAYICATAPTTFSSGALVRYLDECDGVKSCMNTDADESICEFNRERMFECVYWRLLLYEHQVCDGTCDCPDCDDESECNGYHYGGYCMFGIKYFQWRFCYPERLCNGVSFCEDNRDEEDCATADTPGSQLLFDEVGREFIRVGNNSRCFPRLQYRFAFLDQTNCSDATVVMIWCTVGGYNTSVSRYVVCTSAMSASSLNTTIKTSGICDTGIDLECVWMTSGCAIHKHLMCDGVRHCPEGEDEVNEICYERSYRSCDRVTGGPPQRIPLAWVLDGVKDCIDGSDEKAMLWRTCGLGPYTRIHVDSNMLTGMVKRPGVCTDVLICPDCPRGFVEMTENVCQGNSFCPVVRDICEASRSQLQISRTVGRITRWSTGRRVAFLLTCQMGISSRDLLVPCSTTFFPTAEYILGVQRTLLVLPQDPVDCSHVYGEAYVYLSCMGRCQAASCPMLQPTLAYNDCPLTLSLGQRTFTLVDNERLTMVGQLNRRVFAVRELFPCGDGRCVPFGAVCDLVDDCNNGSDEHNCTNHFRCGSGERITLVQVCNGVIDCHDISDECNDSCSASIIPNLGLFIWGVLVALGTLLLNGYMLLRNVVELRNLSSQESITNKVLIVAISIGDFLTGVYLALLTFADLWYGKGFCKIQNRWLSGKVCWVAGILTTTANQLSLLSMTALSVIRVRHLRAGFAKSAVTPVFGVTMGVVVGTMFVCAGAIALTPILSIFEENFLNGIFYTNMPLFAGIPDKATHVAVLERYYGRIRSRDMITWRTILKLMDEMVSQDYGGLEYTRQSFYGNSPVCMFKFFVTLHDPQNTYVWAIILLNSICFVVIATSYISIYLLSRASSRSLATGPNRKLINNRNKALQRKISLIIGTDLITWLPFTIVCILHMLEIINAAPLYAVFSIVVIPINSFINPLLYTDNVIKTIAVTLVNNIRRSVVRLGNYMERGQGNR